MIFTDECIALCAEASSAPGFFQRMRAWLAEEAGIDEARIDEILEELVPQVAERIAKRRH